MVVGHCTTTRAGRTSEVGWTSAELREDGTPGLRWTISTAGGGLPDYDVADDGRFLTTWPKAEAGEAAGDVAPIRIAFLVNWFDELRRRLPPGQ